MFSLENITECMGEWTFQLLDGMMTLEQHLNEGDCRPWNLLIWEKFKCTVNLIRRLLTCGNCSIDIV